MIRLKNIQINASEIECDVYPEDSANPGRIVVDIKSRKTIDSSLPVNFEWCKKHLFHAQNKLLEIADSGNVPNEKLIMWN